MIQYICDAPDCRATVAEREIIRLRLTLTSKGGQQLQPGTTLLGHRKCMQMLLTRMKVLAEIP